MMSVSRRRERRLNRRGDPLGRRRDMECASTAPPRSGCSAPVAAPASGRADGDGDPSPGRQPGEGQREMHHDGRTERSTHTDHGEGDPAPHALDPTTARDASALHSYTFPSRVMIAPPPSTATGAPGCGLEESGPHHALTNLAGPHHEMLDEELAASVE